MGILNIIAQTPKADAILVLTQGAGAPETHRGRIYNTRRKEWFEEMNVLSVLKQDGWEAPKQETLARYANLAMPEGLPTPPQD
jgi:hypothetical protein